MINFTLNGKPQSLDVEDDMPLLWALRATLSLQGTKFGCGKALCGACTVWLNEQPIRSCVTPVAAIAGQAITTIEGLDTPTARIVREAWLALDVAQCGYCQGGQILAATALLQTTPAPTPSDIDQAMSGNLCRCGSYPRIREAVRQAAGVLAQHRDGAKPGAAAGARPGNTR